MAAPTSHSFSADTPARRGRVIAVSLGIAIAAALVSTSAAVADTAIDGPVNIGTAADFAVLGASTVTNTGPSIVSGDLGLSPGTSVTGFDGLPDGTITNGSLQLTNTVAADARSDATIAFGVAAGLSPKASGLEELSGLLLNPGVYSGGALLLSNDGVLTLVGDSTAVWVFQVASTLTIGTDARIAFDGGAGACNVFWRVADSATIGTDAQFAGTVVADQSVTVNTGATIAGRVIALNAAVTLDSNTITAPEDCPPAGETFETETPVITSGSPTAATEGTPYAYAVTSTGTPTPTYLVTGGTLPDGLVLDRVTGIISGTPTTPGTTVVTITATNGSGADDSAEYAIVVVAAGTDSPAALPLVASGIDPGPALSAGAVIVLAGIGTLLIVGRRSARRI